MNRDPALPPPALFRVAVLVRAHAVSEKLLDLLRTLQGSYRYDLYVLMDESRGPVPVPGFACLAYTGRLRAGFGLFAGEGDVMWRCGDYAFHFAAALVPDYDFYFMVEYDVDFVRKSRVFLERLVVGLQGPDGPRHDWLAPQFHEASPLWGWTEAAARRFPRVYNTGTFAFVGASRRCLAQLLLARQDEARTATGSHELVHCEAFCGSAAAAAGLDCASVNDLVPGSVAFDSFHPPSPELPRSFYPINHYEIADPAIEMVHPVYELDAWLARQFERERRADNLSAFRDEVRAITPISRRDAEAVASCLAAVDGHLAPAEGG